MNELMEMAVKGDIVRFTSVHKFEDLDDVLQKLKQNQVTVRVE
jgi:D-arabinose 1-dehydrogenase-like Zn-dependent alcohol dehydrogenase